MNDLISIGFQFSVLEDMKQPEELNVKLSNSKPV
jgi:hypothetical protein